MSAIIQTPIKSQSDALSAWAAATTPIRLFTVTEYEQMAEIGIIGEDERVELIEGRIIPMAAKNFNHAIATTRSNRCFSKILGDHADVRIQDPIRLDDLSEPGPDIALVARPDERYLENHPTPTDIFLVMEIADTSLLQDRDYKCPLYAKNGIIQYCLLNVRDRELEDYRQPGPEGYRSKQTYREDESFTLVAFPEVSIQIKDLLPPVKQNIEPRKK